jgi:hypothetical protein
MDLMPPVTPDLVRWGYRLLLGREPENEQVLHQWSSGGHDLGAFREGILASVEFAANAIAGTPERGDWADDAADRPALEAMLLLRDPERRPDPAEVAALLAAEPSLRPSLREVRRSLLGSPAIEPWLPRREGLRRRVLQLGDDRFTVTGDSRDAEFMGLPGPAPALAALLRALWPDGGVGRGIVDSGAGIGLASVAMTAGAPRHAGLRAYETTLPRVAMLACNIAGLPRTTVEAVPMPPLDEVQRGGPFALLRLAAPEAVETLERDGAGLRASGVTVLLRLDLAAVMLAQRADPRAVLRGLVATWPVVVSLADPARPARLEGEADLDAVLRVALADPQRHAELVLGHDDAWLSRYALA